LLLDFQIENIFSLKLSALFWGENSDKKKLLQAKFKPEWKDEAIVSASLITLLENAIKMTVSVTCSKLSDSQT